MVRAVESSPGNGDMRAPASVGRARNPDLDDAIASATRALLEERGLAALTIEAIARRAGVGRATIYRRWPNLDALLLQVLRSVIREIPIPDCGNVREDLIEMLGEQLQLIEREAGKLYPSLAHQATVSPGARQALRELMQRRHAAVEVVLRRGIERREIRDDIDTKLAFFLLWGPIYYRYLSAFAAECTIEADFVVRLVDHVLVSIGSV